MITENQIHSLAKRWEIDQITVMREYLQILFLFYLYAQRKSDKIFFKGGTAIRFLFGSFRFSEDLDFTGTLGSDEIIGLFNNACSDLSREIPAVEIENFKKKRNSIVSRIRYTPKPDIYPMGIHLEISIRERPITKAASHIETLLPISPYPIVTHLEGEEIMAEKIRAMLKRAKGRDLFDLWYLLSKEVKPNWDMIKKKMEFYNDTATLADVVSAVKAFNQKKLFDDLAKFLPRAQRKAIPGLKENILVKLGRFTVT